MKLFLMIAVVIINATTTLAQHKATFSSQNYVGLLEGEQGSKFQLQTINGFKYKTWFAGVGTGIDWYYRRSIPVFMSFNKDFLAKGNRNFFFATDVGANFPWLVDKNSYVWSYSIEKSIPGFYWGAGVGYKVGIGKLNDGILLQLGYSYKHVGEKAKTVYYYYPVPMITDPKPDMTNRFDYYLRRLSLKVGWNF